MKVALARCRNTTFPEVVVGVEGSVCFFSVSCCLSLLVTVGVEVVLRAFSSLVSPLSSLFLLSPYTERLSALLTSLSLAAFV